MRFLSLLISSFLLVGCGVATNNQKPATNASLYDTEIIVNLDGGENASTVNNANRPKVEILLSKAMKSLREGKHQEAIDKYLNPIIAEFEKIFKGAKNRIYSARGPTESILYLVESIASVNNDEEAAQSGQKNEVSKSDRKDQTKTIIIPSIWSDAFFLKGSANISLGRIDEGKKWLNKAIELSPGNSTFLSELAYIYVAEEKYETALELYEKSEAAVIYSPENAQSSEKVLALRGAGYSLIELGRLGEAEMKYHQALKINPDDYKAKNELEYIRRLRDKAKRK